MQVGEVIDTDPRSARRGYVYRIESSTDGHYYIGSTQDTPELRFDQHKQGDRKPYFLQSQVTKYFSRIGWDNVRIRVLTELVCTREELLRVETEEVREHIGKPMCLNKNLPREHDVGMEPARKVSEELAVKQVLCECGENVLPRSLDYHRTTKIHAKKMLMKTVTSELQENGDEKVACECGKQIRRNSLDHHRLSRTHSIRMQLKTSPPPEIDLPLPEPIPTPEGYSARVIYCRCPCGHIVSQAGFKTHIKSWKHLLAMNPKMVSPTGDASQHCPCGKIISVGGSLDQHQRTAAHKAMMIHLANPTATSAALVKRILEREDAPKTTCECGTTISTESLSIHLTSRKHASLMRKITTGQQDETPPNPPIQLSGNRPQKLREGYIYRLVGTDGSYYIGSTQKALHKRLDSHRNAENLPKKKQPLVTRHFSELGWDNVTRILIKKMLSTREELQRLEGELIDEHIDDPLCLNEKRTGRFETAKERYTRTYTEIRGVKVHCECGDSVIQDRIERHRAGPRHARMMTLKEKPEIPEEKPTDYFETCECGERVRRYNFAQHQLHEKHIWKMRIINLPDSVRKIKMVPVLCSKPEGGRDDIVYCRCPCGAVMNRRKFTDHTKTMDHLINMMENGLIEIPTYKDKPLPELQGDVPEGYQRCLCGELISTTCHIRKHQETDTHKARMRELAAAGQPTQIQPIEEEGKKGIFFTTEAAREKDSVRMTCGCGKNFFTVNQGKHEGTKFHLEWIKRSQEGTPAPLSGVALSKEKIACPCGIVVTRGAIAKHNESAKHKRLIESSPAVAESAP